MPGFPLFETVHLCLAAWISDHLTGEDRVVSITFDSKLAINQYILDPDRILIR